MSAQTTPTRKLWIAAALFCLMRSNKINGHNIKSRKIFYVWSHVTFRSQKPLIDLKFRRIYLTRPKSHLLCRPGTFDNCVITCCDHDVKSAKKYDCFKHQIYQYSFLLNSLSCFFLCLIHTEAEGKDICKSLFLSQIPSLQVLKQIKVENNNLPWLLSLM